MRSDTFLKWKPKNLQVQSTHWKVPDTCSWGFGLFSRKLSICLVLICTDLHGFSPNQYKSVQARPAPHTQLHRPVGVGYTAPTLSGIHRKVPQRNAGWGGFFQSFRSISELYCTDLYWFEVKSVQISTVQLWNRAKLSKNPAPPGISLRNLAMGSRECWSCVANSRRQVQLGVRGGSSLYWFVLIWTESLQISTNQYKIDGSFSQKWSKTSSVSIRKFSMSTLN